MIYLPNQGSDLGHHQLTNCSTLEWDLPTHAFDPDLSFAHQEDRTRTGWSSLKRAQYYSIGPRQKLPRFDHGWEVCFGAEHEGRLLGDVVVAAHARGVAKLRVVLVGLEKKQVWQLLLWSLNHQILRLNLDRGSGAWASEILGGRRVRDVGQWRVHQLTKFKGEKATICTIFSSLAGAVWSS